MKNSFVKLTVILAVCMGLTFVVQALNELRNNNPNANANQQYMQRLQAYQVYTIGTVTYSRYDDGTDAVYITRETVTSDTGWTLTTTEKTLDTWANKVTATYEAINEP